jgi:hypothetical protein
MPRSALSCVRKDQVRRGASQDIRAENEGDLRSMLNPFALDWLFALEREQT